MQVLQGLHHGVHGLVDELDGVKQMTDRLCPAIDAVSGDRQRCARALQDLALGSAARAAQVAGITRRGFVEYHDPMILRYAPERESKGLEGPNMQFRAIYSARDTIENAALCSIESVRACPVTAP